MRSCEQFHPNRVKHGNVTTKLIVSSFANIRTRVLHKAPSRQRSPALAAVVCQDFSVDSKLATARHLSPDTADNS